MKTSTIYLSPEGSDSNSGSSENLAAGLDGPIRSIFRAFERVRQLRASGLLYGEARVVMLPGRYSIHRPIKIFPRDSSVSIVAKEFGTVEICGSVPLSDFSEVTLPNGIKALKTDASALVSYHGPFNVLFYGDRRLSRARYPKTGFMEMERFAHRYEEVDIFQGQNEFLMKAEDVPENWEPSDELQVNILHSWVHERQDVENVDVQSGRITMSSKTAIDPHFTTLPTTYYLENDLSFVTEPGDWYLDRDTGALYVIPEEGEDWDTFTVDVPVTNQWLRLVGDEARGDFVRDVTFEGIRFRHADWKMCGPGVSRWEPQVDMPPRPQRPVVLHAEDPTEFPRPIGGAIQAAHYVPGTIHGRAAKNCCFLNCDFEGPSYYGVLLEDGCENNLIQHCTFSNMGAGAIYLDGSPELDEAHKHNRGNTIADCDIRNGGHVFLQACGILATHTAWTRILHNRIHDMTYTGISVGWQWTYDRGVNRDQLIIGNHVSDIGLRGGLWDMGGIYVLGYQPGSIISENVIEEVHCRGFAGWGIYLDEGASGFLVERNLVWSTFSHSLHEHWGRQNVIRYNCFAHGKMGGIALCNEISHSWVRHPGPMTRIEHNVIVSEVESFRDQNGLLAAGRIEEGHFYHDHNVMWCESAEKGDKVWSHREDPYDVNTPQHIETLDTIRRKGMELHGKILDPQVSWDRETLSFSSGHDLEQLRGNAELWKVAGPRNESWANK